MTQKYGIDVSNHNGNIDWSQVATEKSFVIVRAGYGDLNGVDTHIDPRAVSYIQGAKQYNIAIAGIYWYSYTRTAAYAEIEAKRACKFLRDNSWNVPVYFDFELAYEGYTNTPEEVRSFCTAFINQVKNEGYIAGVYFDPNYYSQYYGSVFIDNLRANGVMIWYAAWYLQQPDIQCDVWQYSSTGSVSGITGNVDLNQILDWEKYFNVKILKGFFNPKGTYGYFGSLNDCINWIQNECVGVYNTSISTCCSTSNVSTSEGRTAYIEQLNSLLLNCAWIIEGCHLYLSNEIGIHLTYKYSQHIQYEAYGYYTYSQFLYPYNYQQFLNTLVSIILNPINIVIQHLHSISFLKYLTFYIEYDTSNISDTKSELQSNVTDLINTILDSRPFSQTKSLRQLGLTEKNFGIKTSLSNLNIWEDYIGNKKLWIDDLTSINANVITTNKNTLLPPSTSLTITGDEFDFYKKQIILKSSKKLPIIYYGRVF